MRDAGWVLEIGVCMGVFDDLGGEWEEVGMGGDLWERLERLKALLRAGVVANAFMTPIR